MIEPFRTVEGFTITINTTENCNLRCKYCYETNKCNKDISLDTCKKFIDIILETEDPIGILDDVDSSIKDIYNNNLIIDVIGGDSLVNPNLLDNLFSYVYKKLILGDNLASTSQHWRNSFRYSTSTNGTLFNRPEVKDFCEKWSKFFSLGVSIDGCPELHDMNRVYADGRGTIKDILKAWDWYRKWFPIDSQITKSTLSKQSIPYLYDSLKFLHEDLKINHINMNFVMEDVGYDKEDLKIFNSQMEKCVDYIFQHKDSIYWSMIDKSFNEAHAPSEDWYKRGWCGSGMMPALSIDGDIYPCFRWLPVSQNKKLDYSSFIVGNVDKGIYNKDAFKKVRQGSLRCNCSKKEECKTCECESVCAYCIAGCFGEFGDFIRTTHTCDLIKSQVYWAKQYWKEYNNARKENN